ncbi:kinase-like protein, partial [Calocera viscosa TUFC12733]
FSQHLVRELVNWSQLSHPNILELYGVYSFGPYDVGMVSPWMEHGDMTRYIQANPDVPRFPLLLDIAQGLDYLHSLRPPIIHGDLRGKNILVRLSGHACLADFGLSRALIVAQTNESSESSGSSSTRGNVRWMSPERLLLENYGMTAVTSFTPAADVYSFGMVLYEVFAGREPFYETGNHLLVFQAVERGDRPAHPGDNAARLGLGEELWTIAQDCWRESRLERPVTGELLRRIVGVGSQDALDPE